jgi:hypothetical protein
MKTTGKDIGAKDKKNPHQGGLILGHSLILAYANESFPFRIRKDSRI